MELRPIYVLGFGVGVTLGLLALLRIGQKLLTPDHAVSVTFREGNTARRMFQVGQVLAVFFVAAAAVHNCVEGTSLKHDAIWVSAFAFAGLVLLVIAERLGISLLLKSKLPTEIARGNVAAGVAGGGQYVATGIVTAHALAGHDVRGLVLSAAFFVIAQITLQAFVALFRALTVYDDAEQIQGENVAAAISYAGVAIAVAILVGHALEGDFVAWNVSLRAYGISLLFAFALWPVRQIVVQSLLLGGALKIRGGNLDDGIVAQRNAGIGVLEAACYVATALSITRLA